MSLLLGKDVGIERLTREVTLILLGQLNNQLDVEDAKWAALDEEMAIATEQDFHELKSDKVDKWNFYPGHRPSLIDSISSEVLPNVSVMTYSSLPSSDQGDHYESFENRLYVEAMIYSGPFDPSSSEQKFLLEAEDEANKKVNRMTEAIHAVIMSNRTLNGLVEEIYLTPTINISPCFRIPDRLSHGDDLYVQIARLDYGINKPAVYF